MAGQPGKKVKQDISTFLTTSKNLQQPGQGEQLKNAYSDITKNVTQAKDTAGQQAQTKTADVATKTSKDTLAAGTKVDQTSYTQPTVKAYTAPLTSNASNNASQVGGMESFLNYAPPSSSQAATDTTNATVDLNKQVAAGKEAIATAGTAAMEAGDKYLSPLEKMLNEANGRITDDAGNIIGSNKSIGLVAAPSTTETLAANRQAALAQQDPNSNIDALRMLLGYNYDPRTAALSSQVYQGDIAGIRGQAKADVAQSAQAEAGRQRSVEDYLKETGDAKTRVGTARTELGTNVDKFLKEAGDTLDKTQKSEQGRIDKASGAAKGAEASRAQGVLNTGGGLITTSLDSSRVAAQNGDKAGFEKGISDAKKMLAKLTQLGASADQIAALTRQLQSMEELRGAIGRSTNLGFSPIGGDTATTLTF
jgi:hypothetical protein